MIKKKHEGKIEKLSALDKRALESLHNIIKLAIMLTWFSLILEQTKDLEKNHTSTSKNTR